MADVVSPLTGTVAHVGLPVGAAVDPATAVVIVESMKMEYAINTGADGTLTEVHVAVGDAVQAGDVLAIVTEAPAARLDGSVDPAAPASEAGPVVPAGVGRGGGGRADGTRPDLAEVLARHERARRRPSRGGGAAPHAAHAPPARTSTTSSTPAPSWSTGPC